MVAVRVGNILILAGDGEATTAARQGHSIVYVDDLGAYAGLGREQGGASSRVGTASAPGTPIVY